MSSSTTGRSRRHLLVTLVVVGALGLMVLFALWTGRDTATPRVVEGWAMPNASGTAIGLHDSPEDPEGEGYSIAGAHWTDVDGVLHQGVTPTCIGTDTATQVHVELGVVTVETEDGSSWDHVVWLRCLE